MADSPSVPRSAQTYTQSLDIEDGPLSALYGNRYRQTFLQYPLNLEAAEENHWVRFDIKALHGAPIEDARASSQAAEGGGFFQEGKILENASKKANALVTTALLAPVNAVNSTVSEFINSLPPFLGGVGKQLLGSGRETVQGLGSVMLYAPHARQESYQLGWQQEAVGQVGGAVLSGSASGTLKQLLAQKGNIAADIASKYLGSAVNNDSLVKINTRKRGVAVNPHLEMFFNSVEFRKFSFDFKLAPRNREEAMQIQKIIKVLKYASAPQYQSGRYGFYYSYPNVFDISMFNEDQTHRIARSALTSIQVNHSGAGVNSTFYDDYPVETDLNLVFTELEILHKDKIDKGF